MNVIQCKMARAGLGWSIDDLAAAVGTVSRRTVAKFEAGGPVSSATVEALRQCLVRHGAEFVNGGKSIGVRVPRRD